MTSPLAWLSSVFLLHPSVLSPPSLPSSLSLFLSPLPSSMTSLLGNDLAANIAMATGKAQFTAKWPWKDSPLFLSSPLLFPLNVAEPSRQQAFAACTWRSGQDTGSNEAAPGRLPGNPLLCPHTNTHIHTYRLWDISVVTVAAFQCFFFFFFFVVFPILSSCKINDLCTHLQNRKDAANCCKKSI